jgi:hypothetical protein
MAEEHATDLERRMAILVHRLEVAERERDRLRKLFDDAGQGEHDVLALIDHYQRISMDAEERLRAVSSAPVPAAEVSREEAERLWRAWESADGAATMFADARDAVDRIRDAAPSLASTVLALYSALGREREEGRREGIEAAARACDVVAREDEDNYGAASTGAADTCAARIRALDPAAVARGGQQR